MFLMRRPSPAAIEPLVFIDPDTGEVKYRIRAVSWPQSALAWIGQPIVRVLQARFRRDSAAALKRATSTGFGAP